MTLTHALLRHVRPAPLAATLKRWANVQRETVVLPDGAIFSVDPVSDFGYRVTSRVGYEPELTQFVKHVIRPSDVFVDVGANEGYFSVLAARRGAWVYAFEPQLDLEWTIKRNLLVNGAKDWEVYPVALADKEGFASLHVSPSTNSGASTLFADGAGVPVPTTTLDRMVDAPHIRLLKIDCEGAEQLVIPGAAKTLANHRVDFLSVEFHPSIIGGAACITVDQQIRSHGYVCTALGSGLWVHHLPGLESDLEALGPLAPVAPL